MKGQLPDPIFRVFSLPLTQIANCKLTSYLIYILSSLFVVSLFYFVFISYYSINVIIFPFIIYFCMHVYSIL